MVPKTVVYVEELCRQLGVDIGITPDLDRLPDDAACLGLKGGAVGAPIDEIGRNQRCEQRQNQQTANGDE